VCLPRCHHSRIKGSPRTAARYDHGMKVSRSVWLIESQTVVTQTQQPAHHRIKSSLFQLRRTVRMDGEYISVVDIKEK